MRRAALPLVLVLAILSASGLTGCAGGGDVLTVYSGRTSNLITPLLEQFHDETGIEIEVRYGDSADLALQIDTEGDRSPADVFISQSPGALGFLAGADRLAALPGDLVAAVPDRFRSDRDLWVGLSGRVRVLVYNTELVDESELPSSVFDLTGRRFRGDVAVAPTNGSFQDFVTAMRVDLGDERARQWLEAMDANDSPTYANNLAIVQAVARGEVPMGLVNHYYNERQLAEDPSSPTRNHFFAGSDIGSLVLVTGAAVIEGTDRPDEARRLVSFLLSTQAQRYFSDETFEYPLAQDVEPAADLPPIDEVSAADITIDDLTGGLRVTRELIERSGLERG